MSARLGGCPRVALSRTGEFLLIFSYVFLKPPGEARRDRVIDLACGGTAQLAIFMHRTATLGFSLPCGFPFGDSAERWLPANYFTTLPFFYVLLACCLLLVACCVCTH